MAATAILNLSTLPRDAAEPVHQPQDLCAGRVRAGRAWGRGLARLGAELSWGGAGPGTPGGGAHLGRGLAHLGRSSAGAGPAHLGAEPS